jgi:hypothetical protein
VKADTLTLKALFQKDVRYVIPMFQRPYVWTQEAQWEELWDDLRNVAEWYLEELRAADGNSALAEEKAKTLLHGALSRFGSNRRCRQVARTRLLAAIVTRQQHSGPPVRRPERRSGRGYRR